MTFSLPAIAHTPTEPYSAVSTIEQLLELEFGEGHIMIEVARCESSLRQFDASGDVLQGHVDNRDTGLYQINEYYWGEKAKELGYNLDSLFGNIKMARWIYDHHGTQPWYPSEPCWNK